MRQDSHELTRRIIVFNKHKTLTMKLPLGLGKLNLGLRGRFHESHSIGSGLNANVEQKRETAWDMRC
jgi:hypothetical protein